MLSQRELKGSRGMIKSPSRIGFFAAALLSLILTNAFYYSRNQQYDFIPQEISSERDKLECELDRMEAELNRSSTRIENVPGSALEEQSECLSSVRTLRARLGQQSITLANFGTLKNEIGQLRQSIERYSSEIKKSLATSNLSDKLAEGATPSEKFVKANRHSADYRSPLTSENSMMTSSVQLLTFREASKDRYKKENRAKRVDFLKMEINFTENNLSNANYPIYARVLDPTGNLVLDHDRSGRIASTQLQYSAKWDIDFFNDGRQYALDWKPSQGFMPGTYLILLFNERGTNMGEASILLR